MQNLPPSHSAYSGPHVPEYFDSTPSASFPPEPTAQNTYLEPDKQLSWPNGYQDGAVLCQATQQPLYRSFQPHVQSPEFMTRVLKEHEDPQAFQHSLLPNPRQPKLSLSVPSRDKSLPIIPKPPPLMQTPASFVFQGDRRMYEVYDHHTPFRRLTYDEYEYYRMAYPQPFERQPLLYPDPRAAGLRDFGMFTPQAPHREEFPMYARGLEMYGRRPEFEFRCNICNIRAGTEEQLAAHFKGKKHMARIEKPGAKDHSVPKRAAKQEAPTETKAADSLPTESAPPTPQATPPPPQAKPSEPAEASESHQSNLSLSNLSLEPEKHDLEPTSKLETPTTTTTEIVVDESKQAATATATTTTTPSPTSNPQPNKPPKAHPKPQRRPAPTAPVRPIHYQPHYYPVPVVNYYRQPGAVYAPNWTFFPPARDPYPTAFYTPYPDARRYRAPAPLLPAPPKRTPLKGCEVCGIPNFTSVQQQTAHMSGKKHVAKVNPLPATAATTTTTASTTAVPAAIATQATTTTTTTQATSSSPTPKILARPKTDPSSSSLSSPSEENVTVDTPSSSVGSPSSEAQCAQPDPTT